MKRFILCLLFAVLTAGAQTRISIAYDVYLIGSEVFSRTIGSPITTDIEIKPGSFMHHCWNDGYEFLQCFYDSYPWELVVHPASVESGFTGIVTTNWVAFYNADKTKGPFFLSANAIYTGQHYWIYWDRKGRLRIDIQETQPRDFDRYWSDGRKTGFQSKS